ncbi:TPA: hypothetical protein ACYSAQ_001446 [Morganella morganii]|nr:hypothetical protein [Morganella morganii]
MKKTIMFLSLTAGFLLSQPGHSATFNDRCNAYVNASNIDAGSFYRFNLVQKDGSFFDNSRQWSFSASNLNIIEMLNMAMLSKSPICITYRTYKDYWEINAIKFQ